MGLSTVHGIAPWLADRLLGGALAVGVRVPESRVERVWSIDGGSDRQACVVFPERATNVAIRVPGGGAGREVVAGLSI